MATNNKKTTVSNTKGEPIDSVPLRILALLIEKRALSRGAAMKVSGIASAIGSDPGEVYWYLLELFGHGFAALVVPIGASPGNASAWLETDPRSIRDYVRSLEAKVAQLQGRADGLNNVASAMAGSCHRWSV